MSVTSQDPPSAYGSPPPVTPSRRHDRVKPDVMEIENAQDQCERGQRAASVLSGMSAGDREAAIEAAETLKSLQQGVTSLSPGRYG